MTKLNIKKIAPVIVLAAALAGYYGWRTVQTPDLPQGIASGNGRIEATEIDVAALTGGRIAKITATEGEFVKAGDVLVQMDVVQLNAQKRQAEAQLRRAEIGVETAKLGTMPLSTTSWTCGSPLTGAVRLTMAGVGML